MRKLLQMIWFRRSSAERRAAERIHEEDARRWEEAKRQQRISDLEAELGLDS